LLQWSAPPPGWTKLNIDGSFCASNGTGGARFVLRDNNGKVLVAACVQLHNCAEAEEAEAAAALLGLLQMENLQVANMMIESDCYAVVKALLSNDQD
jgi:ribonuclease HI